MFEFVLPFIILIIVVVFVHEYGHYYFARRYGVGVTDFSIGFGKELFGWNDKSGTRWKVCWIPLGGYVKFFGDRNVFSQADRDEILKKYNERMKAEDPDFPPLTSIFDQAGKPVVPRTYSDGTTNKFHKKQEHTNPTRVP